MSDRNESHPGQSGIGYLIGGKDASELEARTAQNAVALICRGIDAATDRALALRGWGNYAINDPTLRASVVANLTTFSNTLGDSGVAVVP